MSNDTTNESTRHEVVLLEDDPETLALIKSNLEARGITVHAYTKGEEALQKIMDDASIGALVTDIEIRYPYPNGPRNGLQGYDVANRILRDSPNRLLSSIVLTALEQEEALDSVHVFQARIHPFSKMKWMKLNDQVQIGKTFEALAMLVKEYIELTPNRWLDEVKQLYPKSRWVSEQKDGKKVYPPYWEIYRKMWFSHSWNHVEPDLATKAEEIVQSYLDGDTRKLRGDHLSLTENPNNITFQEHLIGRRVVYALKALEPAYWENMIRGERPEEEKPSLDADIWQALQSEDTRTFFNKLNAHAAEHNLVDKHAQLEETKKKVEKLEQQNKHASEEYNKLFKEQKKLETELQKAKEPMQSIVTQLGQALEKENEEVRKAFVPLLRFWNLDFSEVEWAKKTKSDDKGPLKQMLLLLGIRMEDIQDENPENWKLLLPEERRWLRTVLEKF